MQERVHAEFKVCGGVVVEEEIADAGECGERMCGEFLLEAVGAVLGGGLFFVDESDHEVVEAPEGGDGEVGVDAGIEQRGNHRLP